MDMDDLPVAAALLVHQGEERGIWARALRTDCLPYELEQNQGCVGREYLYLRLDHFQSVGDAPEIAFPYLLQQTLAVDEAADHPVAIKEIVVVQLLHSIDILLIPGADPLLGQAEKIRHYSGRTFRRSRTGGAHSSDRLARDGIGNRGDWRGDLPRAVDIRRKYDCRKNCLENLAHVMPLNGRPCCYADRTLSRQFTKTTGPLTTERDQITVQERPQWVVYGRNGWKADITLMAGMGGKRTLALADEPDQLNDPEYNGRESDNLDRYVFGISGRTRRESEKESEEGRDYEPLK
jgi:hypothetical protein